MPTEDRFRALAQEIPPTALVDLVARHAARDRAFATALQVAAGQLGPVSTADLAPLRTLIKKARGIPNSRYQYDFHDLATAAHAILDELRVLSLRPASRPLLDAVERAVTCWDQLAYELSQDWQTYDDEIGTISDAVQSIHLTLCEQLDDDPLALADRLATLNAATQSDPCLEPPTRYAHLLGPDGLTAYEQALRQRRGW
jgi:hypothetical protein